MQILEKGQYSGSVMKTIDMGGLIASVTEYQNENFNSKLHYHDNAHISFVLSGGCVERKRETYERVPGKITYYSAGEQHEVLKVPERSRHINLEIEDIFLKRHNLTDADFHNAVTKNPEAKFLMLKIYRELISGDLLAFLSIENLFLNLLYDSRKMEQEKSLPYWLSRLKEILHERWNEKITLNELSLATGVHAVTISHYFPKYFSCTLGEYLRKLKVEKAIQLIRTSDQSLTQIAYQCGFFDQSHFIKTFKCYTHYLPAAFKRL